MQDSQENKFTMYGAVETLLDANTAKTDPITAFAPAITAFKAAKEQILIKDSERSSATAGKTESKAQAQNILINAVLPVAAAISALGAATSNPTLKSIGNLTKSKLQNFRDTQLTAEVQTIIDTALANTAALIPYGITVPTVTALTTQLAAYTPSLGSRELSVAERAAASEQVVSLFQQADAILKEQLDKLMELFRNNDPQFYSEYKNARTIYDLGRRSKPVETPTP